MHKIKLSYIVLFFTVICCLASGCDTEKIPELVNEDFVTSADALSPREENPEAVLPEGNLCFSIWSHQLRDANDAAEYVRLLDGCGFDTIDFSVLWSDFEYDENKFTWDFLDSVLNVFTDAGYKLNLSVVFWTYNLSFSEKLDLQETAAGDVYSYDSVRNGFLCLTSSSNLEYMEKALLAFASHVSAFYGESILSWQIKLSELGELEYSSTVDLDYSELSYTAFIGSLRDRYKTVAEFNDAYSFKYESWEEVGAEKRTVITSKCAYDWKLFKQQTLIDTQKAAVKVFRAVNPDIPVVFRLGTVGDSMSAVYRGIFDPYTVSAESDSDIIQSDYFSDQQYNFYLDMMSYTTGGAISFETTGPSQGEEELKKTLTVAECAAKTGIKSFSVSDWTKDEMTTYRDSYLTKYAEFFADAEQRKEANATEIILINTLDFIIRQPPSSVYSIYKYAYKNMTGSSGRRVIFLTDTQIIADPTLLDGVKEIHMGGLNNITYMYDALGDILANGKYYLIDDDNQQPNFLNEYSQPLDIDVQTVLRSSLENS